MTTYIPVLAFGQSNISSPRTITWAPSANAQVWNNNIDGSSVGTAFGALDSTTITPQAAFASALAALNPSATILLIQNGLHDTPIINWRSDYTGTNPMYANMKAAIVAALANASVTRLNYVMFWGMETDCLDGSTTAQADFEQVFTTQIGGETFAPSTSVDPHLVLCTIGSVENGSPAAAADLFNQTVIEDIVPTDPFYRRLINTNALPRSFWDVVGGPIGPGHLLGPGCYEVGTQAARIIQSGISNRFLLQ